jgi:hypothetical protein
MRTEDTKETFSRELPEITRADIARFVKEGRRRRAEAQAELLRSAGRGIARLGHALVALVTTPRSVHGSMKNV